MRVFSRVPRYPDCASHIWEEGRQFKIIVTVVVPTLTRSWLCPSCAANHTATPQNEPRGKALHFEVDDMGGTWQPWQDNVGRNMALHW